MSVTHAAGTADLKAPSQRKLRARGKEQETRTLKKQAFPEPCSMGGSRVDPPRAVSQHSQQPRMLLMPLCRGRHQGAGSFDLLLWVAQRLHGKGIP